MTRLSIAWLLLVAMCTLLLFRVDLHSDLLFLDSMAVDLFRHGGAWRNWTITPAAAYLPDMPAYALAYFVLPSPPQRVVFVCIVQAILLAWACMYLARTIKPSFSTNAKMFVLLVTTAVVLVAARSLMWLFFNSTNNHFAALLFPLLCFAWVIAFLKKKGMSALMLITCGVALGTASTSIFTIAFTAPALLFAAGCSVFFRAQRPLRNAACQIGAVILVGHGIAVLLQKWLLAYHPLEGRPLFTIDAVVHAIKAFVAATRAVFGPDNAYTLALAIFVSVCIAWVLIDWLLSIRLAVVQSPEQSAVAELEVAGKNWAYGLSVTFLLVVFPVNVIGAVLSGGFGDYAGYRYFTFPITLGVLLWIVMLDFKSVWHARRAALSGAMCMVLLAALGISSLHPSLEKSGRTSYAAIANKGIHGAVDFVAQCIDDEAKKGFVFGAGIGDFWNARGLSYKTAQPLYILQTNIEAKPFFHMMSLGPLIHPQQYGVKPYNFAVLNKSGTNSQFNQTPETYGSHLPSPARKVSCANSTSELWLYTDLALDRTVQKNVSQFLGEMGMIGHYALAGLDAPGTVGKVESLSRIAEAGSDVAGYLTYGPYLTVPAGRYEAIISYTSTEPGNKWDAGRFNTPGNVLTLASGEVPAGSGEVKFSFETSDKIFDFEIRTWFAGRGKFAIHKIELYPAGSRQARHATQ